MASRGCCSIPTQWSKDGTIALGGLGFSDDGKYVAYAAPRPAPIGPPGTIMEIATRHESLPDELKWTKFSDASWTKDGKGFFYSRYRRAQAGRRVPGPELQQQALLPPRRHAAIGRCAGLLAAGASRLAIRWRGDATTAAIWSSLAVKGPTNGT